MTVLLAMYSTRTGSEVAPRLQLCDLVLRQGARAEGQDTALVHALQQVQSLTSEAAPTIPPYQRLCPLRLTFVTVLKSCQREPTGREECAMST